MCGHRYRRGACAAAFFLCGACAAVPDPPYADRVVDLRESVELASFIPSTERAVGSAAEPSSSSAVAFNDAARIVQIATSGTLVAPIEITGSRPVLEFDLRFRGSTSTETGQLGLAVLGTDGRLWRLGTLSSDGEQWSETTLSLAGVPKQFPSFLVLDVTLASRAVTLELRGFGLRTDAFEAVTESVTRPPPDPPPDVVVIVLDAARASNFGAYGYARDTTPFMDALAEEGLVFRHAFSECPNTSCSMPNLISGMEFVEVGPAGEWHRLDDRMTTLAEYLGEAGYRTIALSASPNNGKARNNHQGFDEFHELWHWPGHDRNHPERTDPHRLTRLALEAVEMQPPTTPLFLALHYIPPHEPYEPKPEFDLFGDPDYAGPIEPGTMFRGRTARPDDEADLERMISLYDGNLRMADDAVGALFDGLRRLGRWQNTMVLVTSDHGEAFFEHGRQGHNATLYDEMLHVPFILRLPGGHVPNEVRTDRLVILSDTVPTILGQVGVAANADVDGVDLMRTPHASDARVIYHRHTDGRQFAVHTRKWKAILAPAEGRPPMLFNLEADPAEGTNLVADAPLMFHGFAILLRGHILEARVQGLDSTQVELPESDIRALRSLGYLR